MAKNVPVLKLRKGLAPAVAPALCLALQLAAQAPDRFPLLQSCAADADVKAMVAASDAVKVRFSYAGDSGACYAVTAAIDGKPVDGYMIGAGHPALAAFEKEVRAQAPKIPAPVAPVAPAAAPAATAAAAPATAAAAASAVPSEPPPPPLPLSFAGFRAPSVNHGRVDFSMERAPTIVIYFWSARTRGGIKTAERMDLIYDEFHNRGVDVVGVASAASISQLVQVCKDKEVVWPQVLDSGGIANRYHVSSAAPYLVLDQSRKVVAAVATPQALAPILDQITKYRRIRP